MKLYSSKTKQESRELIVRLGLNNCPEIFLNKNDLSRVKEFMDDNPCGYYCIRDAKRSSSKYHYPKNFDGYISIIDELPEEAIVCVSLNSYEGKQLIGAIKIDGEEVTISCSLNPKYDHRTMYENLDFDLITNIFDKRLSKIPYFDFLYNYIFDNKIEGLFIEFTIYDRDVGTNHEKILISELRDY